MVEAIKDPEEKRAIARTVLEALTEWFEVEESREGYIHDCADWTFLAAKDGDRIMGFLCLKKTGNATVELAVMGVMKEYHRNGVGRELVEKAKEAAKDEGYEFMQVKTVKMGVYDDYDRTNLFYISCGFREFEVFPLLWDEANPCQIYVMSLNSCA
ncbi:MAG: GNAT family N-acetyltransferase [Lachnospiraceae bacterium]|nr:GNAT family N-acetyltransferase [Lachnospiraceae bacterium]